MPELALTVEIDATNTLSFLHNAEKRMAFALVNALNATAKDIQLAEQKSVDRSLKVRKAPFIHREVAVAYFARPGFGGKLEQRLEARIRVGSETNPKKNLLLARYEEGDMRKGFMGGNVAVPAPGGARQQPTAGIDPALTFAAMKLQQGRPLGPYAGKRARITRKMRGGHVRGIGVHGEFGRLNLPAPGGKTIWRGRNRTFLIPGVAVFQRLGKGSTRAVWFIRPSVKIPASLHWLQTARGVAEAKFQGYLRAEVYKELEYALKLHKLIAL